MRRFGIGIAAGLYLAVCADFQLNAEPLNSKHVAADARWLGHVDFDAMRSSIVVQKAVEKAKQEHKHVEKRAAIVRHMLGVDPKDLHGLTFYGKEIGKRRGVLIVHGKVDQKRLLEIAGKFSDREVTQHGSYELHSWTHKGRKGTRTVAAAFHESEAIILSSSVDELKAALDVLDGSSASLGSESPLAGNVPLGTTLLFRVAGVSKADLPHKSPLARQTEAFRFVVGENDGQSFYRARVQMTSAEVVSQLNAVVEGARALAQLHIGDRDQEKKLVDALRVKAEGETLTLLWSAPAGEVWQVIERHAKVIAEKRAAMGHKGRHHRWGHHDGDKNAPEKGKTPPEEDF